MSCAKYSLVLKQCWHLWPSFSDSCKIFVMLTLQTFSFSLIVCYILCKIVQFWVDIAARRLRLHAMQFFISFSSPKYVLLSCKENCFRKFRKFKLCGSKHTKIRSKLIYFQHQLKDGTFSCAKTLVSSFCPQPFFYASIYPKKMRKTDVFLPIGFITLHVARASL